MFGAERSRLSDKEPYDHGKDTEEFFKASKNFYEAMRDDPNITMAYAVKMVTKVRTHSFHLTHPKLEV